MTKKPKTMPKMGAKPELQVFSKSETLRFHYHPAVIRQNLREFIAACDKQLETATEETKGGIIAVKKLYEDCLLLAEFAISKMQPLKPDSNA